MMILEQIREHYEEDDVNNPSDSRSENTQIVNQGVEESKHNCEGSEKRKACGDDEAKTMFVTEKKDSITQASDDPDNTETTGVDIEKLLSKLDKHNLKPNTSHSQEHDHCRAGRAGPAGQKVRKWCGQGPDYHPAGCHDR